MRSLWTALFEEGYHFWPILGENEGLLRLSTSYGRIPGEGLADPYLLLGVRGCYDLARGVAGHTSLMMQLPLIREPRFRVEALAVGEGVGEGVAGAGGLLPHTPQDHLAGFLPALKLCIRFLKVDHPGDVGVEPTALGAHHEHGPVLHLSAVWDRMAVAGDAVVGGCQEYRAEELPTPAGSRQVRGCFILAHSGLQRPRRLRHCSCGVGSNLPVAFQGVGIQDVAQGRY